jgi:hypothetical protein
LVGVDPPIPTGTDDPDGRVEPGQYAVRIVDNGFPLQPFALLGPNEPWTVGDWHAHMGLGEGEESVVPTDTWPPPDAERITWYRDRIARGATPLVILIAPGPPRPVAGGPPRFLLDGHHKLAAGARLALEISPCRDDGMTDTQFAGLIEPYLRTSPLTGRGVCSGGSLAGSAPTDAAGDVPVMSAAEYYALYGVRYGNPAAAAPHHVTAEWVLGELTDRTGAERLIRKLSDFAASMGLRDLTHLILYPPALFESRLLDGLSGVLLSKQEHTMIAESVTDIDDPRLAALTPG